MLSLSRAQSISTQARPHPCRVWESSVATLGKRNRVDLVFRGSKSLGGDFHCIDGQPLGHGVDARDRFGQREVHFCRVVENVQRLPVSVDAVDMQVTLFEYGQFQLR